jgi:hypothetical protein
MSAKGFNYFFKTRGVTRYGAMRDGICINAVCAKMFEHASDNTFARTDAAG